MNLLYTNAFIKLIGSKIATPLLSPNPIRRRVGFYNPIATANTFLWFDNSVNANIGFNVPTNPGFLEFDLELHGNGIQGSWWIYYNTVATVQYVVIETLDPSLALLRKNNVPNQPSNGIYPSNNGDSCLTTEQAANRTYNPFRAYGAFIRRLRSNTRS